MTERPAKRTQTATLGLPAVGPTRISRSDRDLQTHGAFEAIRDASSRHHNVPNTFKISLHRFIPVLK